MCLWTLSTFAFERPTHDVCEEDDTVVKELTTWIKEKGGLVDERQTVRREDPSDSTSPRIVYANAFIPKGTVLLSMPWDMVMEPDYSPGVGFCDMVEILKNEFEKHEKGESEYGPYVRYLQSLNYPRTVPNGWSPHGKILLKAMIGENLLPEPHQIDKHLHAWEERCGGDIEGDETGRAAALLVTDYRSPNTSEDEDDEDWHYMVPFYDLYSTTYQVANTFLLQDENNNEIEVISSRDIEAEELIRTAKVFGVPIGVRRPFIHRSVAGPRFSFSFYDESAASLSAKLLVDFDYEVNNDESRSDRKGEKCVTWVDGIRASSRAYAFLQAELERLEKITNLLTLDDIYLLHPAPKHERKRVLSYASDFIDALSAVIDKRHEPAPITPYTIADYEVAGVNLASYNLIGVEQAEGPEAQGKPFELFENFDISNMIVGDEIWEDMIEYRRKLNRPSMSFYVDKVARKRWLPSQNIPQGQQYVLKYQFELSETGDIDEEIRALYNLIPDQMDYAAKPSHKSLGNGVWLVSYDKRLNASTSVSAMRHFFNDGNATFDKWAVSTSLAEDLHTEADREESTILKTVKPGVVVEERFVSFMDGKGAPVEFNMFVIWGKLWVAKMNNLGEEPQYVTTWVYRNGSVPEDASRPPELDYLMDKWSQLVELAEKLGANKDMLRVDIFVGLPMGSQFLWTDVPREERMPAIMHTVSECEIYPTTSFHRRPGLSQEGARLWVAGYMIGNYNTVANTEIPNEYLETGNFVSE